MPHRTSSPRIHRPRRVRALALRAVLAFAFALFACLPARAVDVTVGADVDCDFADLQSAIDAVESGAQATIRLAARQLRDLSIDIAPAGSLVIAGGYETCSSANATGETDLLGDFRERVFTIDGPSAASVAFRDVVIGQGSGPEGGGILARGGVHVLLVNSHVNGNDAERGGGIALQGGSLTLSTSLVSSNRAVFQTLGPIRGGGIHCTDGGRIELLASSRVLGNSAGGGSGGGLYLEKSCELQVSSSTFDLPSEIDNNRAEFGGGVFARSSKLVLRGDFHTPVRIRRNLAESESGGTATGGGILLTAGATLVAENALLEANTAKDGIGGALAVLAGSHARVARSLGPSSCHTEDRCSRVGENAADSGAAAYVNGSGSVLEIEGTYVEGNVGLESVIETNHSGSVRTSGTVFGENVAPRLAHLDAGGHARLLFTTVAANDLSTGSEAFSVSGGAELELLASIVFEPEVDVLGNFGAESVDVRCVLASETASLAGGQEVEQGAPAFAQAPVDYHLIEVSEAIDFCSPSLVGESALDLDLAIRGVDADRANRGPGTLLDLGADEFDSGEGIFVDGFESGDLSGWGQPI